MTASYPMKSSNKGMMRLFITGEQEPEFISDTLNELDESFGLTCVMGSACSPCMTEASKWCNENDIRMYLQLPEYPDELGLIECNLSSIRLNKPEFLLIYTETDRMVEAIANIARITPSIQYIAKKVVE